jgi:hypothetical protein
MRYTNIELLSYKMRICNKKPVLTPRPQWGLKDN